MPAPRSKRVGFKQRLEATLHRLTPSELRLARFLANRKEAVVLGSAVQIAEQAGTSDATVVRTVRALGYDSLADLRQDMLAELTHSSAPARRMSRTLIAAGTDPAAVLDHVLQLHDEALAVLRHPDTAATFSRALGILAAGTCRHVFGIGPSGALARYAALQFNRIGLRSLALTETGVAQADPLMWLQQGDAVLMMAYAPLYGEVAVLLDRAQQRDIPVVLISDSLGPLVTGRVREILPVPRGKADHLAMHGGTMVLIEALILGLAAGQPDRAIDALDDLSSLRGTIDKRWQKRGTRKPAR